MDATAAKVATSMQEFADGPDGTVWHSGNNLAVKCPGCGERIVLPLNGRPWKLTSRDPLTLNRKVHHNDMVCGWMGRLVENEWRPEATSTT